MLRSRTMQDSPDCNFTSFFVAGISYKKSDAILRGRFSINKLQYKSLLHSEQASHLKSFFILSTCNRIEIYGLANNAQELATILCQETDGTLDEFNSVAYTLHGTKAIRHLFEVASGMDSQILGDYEITGQLKTCIRESKVSGRLNYFLERLANEIYAACKEIRSKTKFSSGTVSVSFAAIRFIKQKYQVVKGKKILLIGTGKIGTNTCRNILDYLPGVDLTVVNRSQDRAEALAKEFQISSISYEKLNEALTESDIVIVATQASEYVVNKNELLENKYPFLFIDLSVPCNINKDVKELSGVSLIGVDELSKINDATLASRAAELPLVQSIIENHIVEFANWNRQRENVPKLIFMKEHLLQVSKSNSFVIDFENGDSSTPIQKTLNGMAVKLQQEPLVGCNYLQALSEFIKTHSN